MSRVYRGFITQTWQIKLLATDDWTVPPATLSSSDVVAGSGDRKFQASSHWYIPFMPTLSLDAVQKKSPHSHKKTHLYGSHCLGNSKSFWGRVPGMGQHQCQLQVTMSQAVRSLTSQSADPSTASLGPRVGTGSQGTHKTGTQTCPFPDATVGLQNPSAYT